jgi:hypothetical protein
VPLEHVDRIVTAANNDRHYLAALGWLEHTANETGKPADRDALDRFRGAKDVIRTQLDKHLASLSQKVRACHAVMDAVPQHR